MWQDTAMAGSSLILASALIPTILGKEKPALATSLLTGVMLSVLAVSLGTLSLWAACAATTVSALGWFTLAGQRISRGRKGS